MRSAALSLRGLTLVILTIFAVMLGRQATAQERVEPVEPVEPDQATGSVTAGASVGGGLGFDRELRTDLRWGPFRIRPGLSFGSGAESVVRAASDGSFRLDARFFVDAGPVVDVVLPMGEEHRLSASGDGLYRWYMGSGQQRQPTGWDIVGTAGYEFTGKTLTLATTYRAAQRQQSQLSFIEQGGVLDVTDVDERVETLEQTAGVRLAVRIGGRSELELQGSRSDVAYSDEATFGGIDLSDALDRVGYQFAGALNRELSPRTTLSFRVDATRSDYRLADSFRDNWRQRAALEARFGGEGTLTGSVTGGYERRSLDSEERESFQGPFAEGTLRYQVISRLALWLRGDVRTYPTFWENNVYSINERVGTGLDVWVHRRVNLGAFVDYGWVRYPEPTTFDQLDGTILTAERRDNLMIYRGTATVRIFGQSLTLQGGYFDRESNFTALSRRGYFVRLGLSAMFSRDL